MKEPHVKEPHADFGFCVINQHPRWREKAKRDVQRFLRRLRAGRSDIDHPEYEFWSVSKSKEMQLREFVKPYLRAKSIMVCFWGFRSKSWS